MSDLIEMMLQAGPVVTDGAWGTQMQQRGLPVGACPDEWNLLQPDRVEDVARSYVEAGSQVILTNTFGANRIMLGRHGLANRAAEINRVGAAISRRAADGRARVFASMGPTGVILMMGDVPAAEVRDAFVEQASSLAEGGADALVIETMSDLDEACLAVEAARTTGLPVVASIVFDSGANHDRTMMGTTPEQAVEMLQDAGASVIGSNCGIGADMMLPVCRRLRAATELPVWIKPNAGLPEMDDGRAVYRTNPTEFAAHAVALVEAGASFIGGCCGTGPAFIQAVVNALRHE